MATIGTVKISELTPDLRWDAEHYRPEYLNQARALARFKTTTLGKVAAISDGNHLSIAEDFVSDGVRYLRGKDLADFFISDADPIYIPESNYASLARSHIFPNDVLVGIVGTIGTIGLVTERHGRLTGNCKLAIVRAKALPPEYIATYLASRVGQYEIARRTRGAVQMGLILPDLKELPIVLPDAELSRQVVSLVRRAQTERKRSAQVMLDAEKYIMELMGVQALDLESEKVYSRAFSDLQKGNRFGAEYYMPCKTRALEALAKRSTNTVAFHAPSVRELWDPNKAPASEKVRNFDVSAAFEPILDDSGELEGPREIGSTKKILRSGDVAISRLRSYLKQIAVVRTTEEVTHVGSSEFIVLRPAGTGLSAQALAMFLRSPVVQAILRWSQDGSNHPRFAEEDLLAIPVPDSVDRGRDKIEILVNQAIDARRASVSLLRQATNAVEDTVLR